MPGLLLTRSHFAPLYETPDKMPASVSTDASSVASSQPEDLPMPSYTLISFEEACQEIRRNDLLVTMDKVLRYYPTEIAAVAQFREVMEAYHVMDDCSAVYRCMLFAVLDRLARTMLAGNCRINHLHSAVLEIDGTIQAQADVVRDLVAAGPLSFQSAFHAFMHDHAQRIREAYHDAVVRLHRESCEVCAGLRS